MKALINVLCCIVSVMMITVSLVSCVYQKKEQPDSSYLVPVNELDSKDIDQEIASTIKRDYLQKIIDEGIEGAVKSVNELIISDYYGNYSGAEIFYIYDGIDHIDVIRPVEIAGYVIEFGSSQILWAYKDHNFYTIKEAYETGLITAEDVYSIGTKIGFGQD